MTFKFSKKKKHPKYAYRYCLKCQSKRLCFKTDTNKFQCWKCKGEKTLRMKDASSIIREKKEKKLQEEIKATKRLKAKQSHQLLGSNFLKKDFEDYRKWLEKQGSQLIAYSYPPLILRGKE